MLLHCDASFPEAERFKNLDADVEKPRGDVATM
jgi:hypothetical protein